MLEQIAYQIPRTSEIRQQTYFVVGDLESLSAGALYTGEPCGSPKFSGNKLVVPYGNLGIKGLDDLHDTFDVDRSGNLYSGHTTFNNDFHINTDILKSRKDNILKR